MHSIGGYVAGPLGALTGANGGQLLDKGCVDSLSSP